MIRVPNWTPPSLNHFVGRSWHKLHKAKREATDFLVIYAAQAGVKTVAPALSNSKGRRVRRRLSFTIRTKGVLPDPDNLLKVLLDSLKRAHLIVDDSAQWVEYTRPAVERCAADEQPSTTITVEDLPDEPAQPEPAGGV